MEALIELMRRLELLQDPSVPVLQSPREAVARYFSLLPLDQIPRMQKNPLANIKGQKPQKFARELARLLRVKVIYDIVNDLKMKYLRKRMIIAVDLDALSQRAIAEIMQGSRSGLYEGQVYQKIRDRLVATLQGDPDLAELEEEAEDELSQLQAGDAVVQNALDELIEHHFDFGDHETGGFDTSGAKQGQFYGSDGKPVDVNVVVFGENGAPVTGPVLVSDHAASTLRVVPNSKAKLKVTTLPKSDWIKLKDIGALLGASHGWFDRHAYPKRIRCDVGSRVHRACGFPTRRISN